MKQLLLGVSAMVLSTINPALAMNNAQDEAAIKTVVESIGTLADTHNFTALEQLYAPEVQIDYTSLMGGEIQLKSNKALMTEWASFLPGFDRTRHQLSNMSVVLAGNYATASADIVADHYVGELHWQVQGSYIYKLRKEDDVWRVISHTLNFAGEEGTRDVFGAAIAQAAENPSDYILRQQTQQAVIGYLEDKQSVKSSQLVLYPMMDPHLLFVELKEDRLTSWLFYVEGDKVEILRAYNQRL